MDGYAAWEEIQLVLGEFSSWTHIPLSASGYRFLVLSSSCEKLLTGQLTFFFFSERTTFLKYFRVLQEGFLAGCRFLSYWCPGLAGVLLSLKMFLFLPC